MSSLPYDVAAFFKGETRIGEMRLTTVPPDTLVWGTPKFGEALWRAAGSIGKFEVAYEFVQKLPKVVDDGDEKPV